MRIISGEFRHRKLHTPPDATITRPIPDRVKEAVFSLLRGWTEDASVLDAFAGTGAIGLEAVSRGAARCVFLERDRRIAELLQKNIDMLGCGDRCELVKGDALGPALLTRCPKPVDLVFFDPPYPLIRTKAGWIRVATQFSRVIGLMKEGHGFAVLRTPWPFRHPDQEPEDQPPPRDRSHGKKGSGRGADRSDEKVWEGEDLRAFEAAGYVDEDEIDDVDEFFDEADQTGELDDADDAEEAGAAREMGDDEFEDDEFDEEAAGPKVTWHEVDLKIEGAVGPETHIYGSSAVHFYQRKKS